MNFWCWSRSPHLLWLCRMPEDGQRVIAPEVVNRCLCETLWPAHSTLIELSLRWTNYCKNERDHVERRVKGWTVHSFTAERSRKGGKRTPRGLRDCKIWSLFCFTDIRVARQGTATNTNLDKQAYLQSVCELISLLRSKENSHWAHEGLDFDVHLWSTCNY